MSYSIQGHKASDRTEARTFTREGNSGLGLLTDYQVHTLSSKVMILSQI